MAFVVKDRVRETTLTTGTGTITLAGAVIGYQTFSAIGDGNNTFYTIAGQATSEWEVGIGTYTASGTTLSRDTILASSNSGSAVNFSAGTKDVFVTYPAGKAIFQNNLDSVVVAANTSSDALRITQTGSGNALLVEDSANPDATPFVVDASGNTVIGYSVNANYSGDKFNVVGDGSAANVIFSRIQENVNPPTLSFVKSRGASVSSASIVQSGDQLGSIYFKGNDGSGSLPVIGAQILVQVDGTPGTNDMPGRLVFSTTADGASSPTERMRIDSSGAVGIGAAPSGIESLVVSRNISGAVTSYGINNNGVVQSGVTTAAYYFVTSGQTAAASFTLGDLMHYRASQGTFGAGSTVTNQYGFIAAGNLTGATNNYGFYSNIAAGTGRWNFYAAGTAQNAFAGNVLIGSGSSSPYGKLTVLADRASIAYNTVFTTYNGASFENDFYIGFNGTVTNVGNYQSFPIAFITNNTERMRIDSSGLVGIGGSSYAGVTLRAVKSITGSTFSTGILSDGTVQSDVTGAAYYFQAATTTAASAFTTTTIAGFLAKQNTIGAGSTVTGQYGFLADSTLTGATNNFGFYSNIASGTGRWNFYANGTASNYFGGNTIISVADNTNAALRITQTGAGNALLVEDSANPDSTPFVVESSGDVIIGSPTAIAGAFSDTGKLQIAQNTGEAVQQNFAFTNSTSGSYLYLNKSRSATVGTNTIVQNGDIFGGIVFAGADGTTYHRAAAINAEVDGTPGTNDMPGRLVFSTTADGASSPTERMRIDSAGRVGIGIAPATSTGVYVNQATTDAVAYGFLNTQTAGSSTTNTLRAFQTSINTSAASFTLGSLNHYFASQGSLGAGSSVTNQLGFVAASNLTGATNNYGFYSDIASGTGRWNFYANGTASNYFGGNTIISVADNTNAALRITQTGSGNALLVEDSANPDATPFVINSGGQTTVGYTSQPWFITGVVPLFGVVGTDNLTATSSIARYSNDSSQAWLMFGKSRGASIGTNTVVQNGDNIGSIDFSAADGTSNIPAARITASVDGTPGTNDMPGRLTFSTTADGSSSLTERMRIDSAGNVGIGGAANSDTRLNISGTLPSSSAISKAVFAQYTIPSTSTTQTVSYLSYPSTQAASFSAGQILHFYANQGTIGAGSSITSQTGFYAEFTLTGATNNYGFVSSIASGTGRWNFYASGTADNYFAGRVGIGAAAGGDTTLGVAKNITGAVTAYGVRSNGTIQSDVTTTAYGFISSPSTVAAAFTLSGGLQHFSAVQGTIGAGSTVTNQYGFFAASSLTGATNNYGFLSNIPSGTGRWNFYANGTAQNYFEGLVGLKTTANNGGYLEIGGTANVVSNSGYGVTQYQTIPSTATSQYWLNTTVCSTAAASFTLSDLRHYNAGQGTFGAGSTVTSQYGFFAQSNLTGATNNYGFFSNIASGTGRWNFYANGTADNYFAGRVGIGATPDATSVITQFGTVSGGTTGYLINSNVTAGSSVTSAFIGFSSFVNTSASAFTLTSLTHVLASQGTIGAGSTVTNQFGYRAASTLTGATNNYGFYSDIASGSGRWNFYASGTAANYFAGDMQLDKTVTAAGTTGAQTINKNAGTVNFAAAATSLVVTDSRVSTTSIIICTVGTNDSTMKSVAAVAGAGSFTLHANAAATAETRVNFLIIN